MDTVVDSHWKLPFFTLWTGQTLSQLGSRVATFALVWWLAQSTGSATALATATLFAVLPRVFLGPIAGPCVDRWNRRRAMIVADGFIALARLWLAFMLWAGAMQVWHIYAVTLAGAIGGVFHDPAMGASTSLMVPKEHLSRVSGLGQMVGSALNIVIGLIGGGLVLSAWGGFRRRMHTTLAGLILQGLATVVVGLAPANAF